RVTGDAIPEPIPVGGSGISGYTPSPSAGQSQPVRFEGEGGASSWISPAWEVAPIEAPASFSLVEDAVAIEPVRDGSDDDDLAAESDAASSDLPVVSQELVVSAETPVAAIEVPEVPAAAMVASDSFVHGFG